MAGNEAWGEWRDGGGGGGGTNYVTNYGSGWRKVGKFVLAQDVDWQKRMAGNEAWGEGRRGGTNDVTNYGSGCWKDVVSLYLQLPGRWLA